MAINENKNPLASIPLLSWDMAHPMLRRHQQLVSDIQAFTRLKVEYDWRFETDIRQQLLDNHTIVITEQVSRIIWVSSGFSGLTGYQPAEMMGKSPALLQGPGTNARTKLLVRQKLAGFEAVTVTIQNYRKEQTPYWCRIAIYPLFNGREECTHFIAFEKELPN